VGQLQHHANRLEELGQAASRGPSSNLSKQASHQRALIRSIPARSHRRQLAQEAPATKTVPSCGCKSWMGSRHRSQFLLLPRRQLVSHSAACRRSNGLLKNCAAGVPQASRITRHKSRITRHASHVTRHTSHATCLTSHFSCQGYNSVCSLNIKCSGNIHTNDLDSVVARWFTSMAETMIAAGMPRDKLFTHAGANWGTMPKDVEWNSLNRP
jgi:hypothetical protein